MRAIVYDRYGPPTNLRLADIPVSTPRPDEILVEVVATALNLSDWESLTGSPGYARFGGLTKPRRHVLGSDIAGRVAAVGAHVTTLAVGDDVYGDNLQHKGGFADYAIGPASAFTRKPKTLPFAEAATIPQSGAIAVQAVAHAEPGERMLINGAGGGTGSFLVQLAKARGIHVTGVDTGAKLDFMRDLGADDVIDYRTQDFTRTAPYDLVIDLVASRSIFAYRRALAPGGRYFMVGGTARTLLRLLTVGPLLGMLSRRHLGVLFVRAGPTHFEPLAERVVAGEVRVFIDRVFPLESAAEALEYHGRGLARGKVLVTVRDE